VNTAAGQKAVAKRRSLGSIIRSRLSRAVKRSRSAERAVQRPSDLDPVTHGDLDPGSLTPPPPSTHRTSVGEFTLLKATASVCIPLESFAND